MKNRFNRAMVAVFALMGAVAMNFDAINIIAADDRSDLFDYYIILIAAMYAVSLTLFTINVATYKRR